MSPVEREHSLTNRTLEARERILAKVQQYQLLPPEEREIRLRATDLRWWLTPMLSMTADARKQRLAQVPDDLRPLIQARLEQWSILPPALREEFLANERALHYFALVPTSSDSSEQQRQIAKSLKGFFDLTPEEKEQTLGKLSDEERNGMEETLKAFDHLPVRQRELCMRNYARFAGMSRTERAEFLRSADRWSKMSPEERKEWRDLVQQAPIWPTGWSPNLLPPLPSDAPQPPVGAALSVRPSVATN